jgi:multidrug efflux pump subunit AcrB
MLERLYQNHVLTNLVFVLVMIVGVLSYLQMPRQQDPTINFNWIDISTLAPGMAAQDVEQRVTDILEEGIRKVSDIKFVQSTSRDSFSHVLVRFNELNEREFDKRINDLRREIQDKQRQLPEAVEDPSIFEVTTANAFPSATVVVTGVANDANLRIQAERVKKDLERISGVDRILDTALQQPELQVLFDPDKLERLGLSPGQLADVVSLQYRDISAGSKKIGADSWLVRYQRMQLDAAELAKTPMFGAHNDITLAQLASVQPGWEKPQHYVLWEGRPAVMLAVTKQGSANTLDLVERIKSYIETTQAQREVSGVKLYLADDQTEITRNALNVMQTNAAIGLMLVLLVAWLFLGFRVAFLTAIAIPFVLAGTFWILQSTGETLNVMVLLGVVISLGMLVDDAVVVVESIYYRLQRREATLDAVINGFKEVAAPVTTAVFTTIAAFLPLMLLPGIIGKFMRLVPFVVTVALLISLLEAFWILPSHILNAKLNFAQPGRSQRWRAGFLRKLRRGYTRILIKVMRVPALIITFAVVLFGAAIYSAIAGQINPGLMQDPAKARWLVKTDFFASDPLRLFYISVEMENGTPLEVSLDKIREVQEIVHQHIEKEQLRSVVAYAGQLFTETAPLQGEHYAQLLVSLPPTADGMLEVDELIDRLRTPLEVIAGPKKLYFIRLAGGPPISKAISVKVRGDEIESIRAGVSAIKAILQKAGWAKDVADDDSPGLKEMALTINQDAMQRSGVNLGEVLRSLRLLVDGEVVAEVREQGETVQVRVKAKDTPVASIERLLDFELSGKDGVKLNLSDVLDSRLQQGFGSIKHYNFRRTITVEADIDKQQIDVPQANQLIMDEWEKIAYLHPQLSLDFTGQLDDLNESLDSIAKLMLFGLLLMYAILGTQFKSYFEPMMILMTVPMAFTGVVVGLLVTQNPLSLFTLYGVVALAGIAVNAAIVLISAANSRLESGMNVVHAAVFAARRRVIPILITSLTTVAGLFSLALGLGGKSLLWGPVATAIVWGLAVSTVLTLLVVPMVYRIFMGRGHKARSLEIEPKFQE